MERLANESVLIVGVGGLGIPAAEALATAGVGKLGLIDSDPVELSNLHRQVIFGGSDIGTSKVVAAARRLAEAFPGLEVESHACALTSTNASRFVGRYRFVVDATDNPEAKFLINDTCLATGRPFVYGGIIGWTGQAMTVIPAGTACLRCLFEEPPDEAEIASCREAGIIGPVAGAIGELQAAEAVRFLSGDELLLAARMLTYDAAGIPRVRLVPAAARPGCRCGAWRQGSRSRSSQAPQNH